MSYDWEVIESALLETLSAWHIRGSLAQTFIKKLKFFLDKK